MWVGKPTLTEAYMEKVKLLQLDLLGTNPDNYIDEVQPVTDRTRDWYRPDYAPFYEEDFELYDGSGMLLRKNKDYVFESLSDELLGKSGKPVYLFFRILNTTLNNKKSFRIKYRSLGNTGFPRSLIQKMTNELIHSEYWVDWETQVLGKPETFPAYQHWHDIVNEVANWDQFITFAQTTLEMVVRGRKDHWVENETKIDRSEREFSARHKSFWDALDKHDRDYNNPHKLVRGDFSLTQIPNYPLSDLGQDLNGVDPTSFTTPKGLQRTVELKRRISPGHVAAGRIDYTTPPSTIGVTRSQNIDTLSLGGIQKFLNGDMNYIVAGSDEQYPTSILLSDDHAELQQTTHKLAPVYPQIGGKDQVMDRTLRVLGKGYCVSHHSDNLSALFYPDASSVNNSTQKNCVKLNTSNVNQSLGSTWSERSWFFLVGDIVFLLGAKENTIGTKYELYSAKITSLSPNTTLVLQPHPIGVEDNDGIVSAPTESLDLLDVVKTGTDTYRTFHHVFVSDVKPVFGQHMTLLTGDVDLRSKNGFFIKIIKTILVNGKALPIEMSWSLDLDKNVLYRNLNGSNAKTYKTLNEIETFDEKLAECCKINDNYFPDVQFSMTGVLHILSKNAKVRRLTTMFDSLEQYYLNRVGPKVLTLPVDQRLVGLPTDTSNWHFGILSDSEMIYLGKRVKVNRMIWDLRQHVTAGSSGSIFIHLGYIGGKVRPWVSKEAKAEGRSVVIAKLTYNASGIASVDLYGDI